MVCDILSWYLCLAYFCCKFTSCKTKKEGLHRVYKVQILIYTALYRKIDCAFVLGMNSFQFSRTILSLKLWSYFSSSNNIEDTENVQNQIIIDIRCHFWFIRFTDTIIRMARDFYRVILEELTVICIFYFLIRFHNLNTWCKVWSWELFLHCVFAEHCKQEFYVLIKHSIWIF